MVSRPKLHAGVLKFSQPRPQRDEIAGGLKMHCAGLLCVNNRIIRRGGEASFLTDAYEQNSPSIGGG